MALTKIGPSLGGSADIINVTQTSHTFVSNDRGKAVRMNNNSGTPQYVFARANTTANADALGIIIHVIDGNNFTMATSGRITVDYCVPNEVAGTVLFLSEITAGVLTSTEPSGNTEVSKPMAVITIANSEMIMLQQRGEVISTAGISIADDAVTTAKIADDAVTSAKIAAGTIVGVDIADGVITAQKLASGSVGTSQLANNQVTGDKIALGSDAQGDVMYYNGTDWVRLGFGTSGHFLKTQGTGANPLWAAATSAFIGVRVENSSSQSIGNNSATIIVFDAAVTQFDTDTMHSPSADTKITFTTAGKYWVGLSYAWAGNSTGRRNIWVSKNNSATIFRQTILPSTADEAHDGFGFIYEFAAADYIYFYGHQTSGGALNLVADNESATVAMAYKID
jgi:hypothetical protein